MICSRDGGSIVEVSRCSTVLGLSLAGEWKMNEHGRGISERDVYSTAFFAWSLSIYLQYMPGNRLPSAMNVHQ